MSQNDITLYEYVGGEETFQKLVDVFYAKVEADPELRRIFPKNLEPGKRRQFLFLMQYFGGPQTYSMERGHPRLRMRHMPYTIDNTMRDHWLGHMLSAIDEVGIQEPARSEMRNYFEYSSEFMINTFPQDES